MRITLLGTAALAGGVVAASSQQRLPRSERLASRASDGLQDIVTWDPYSLFINSTRTFIWSGEVHPYRMPVHGFYLDIFQKMKAIGLNAVSFYSFWGMHEPKRGAGIDMSGFRDLQPFLDAAKEAGLWVIARPGPYINAETVGGGFPGWGVRDPAIWRTSNETYYDAWQDYMREITKVIAANQITKGGPVILYQSENEYTGWTAGLSEDAVYEKQLLDKIREWGIEVPITHNDASPSGHYRSVDIWGYDAYPVGFDCSNPYTWGANAIPDNFWQKHMQYSPEVPNAVYEYQGGAFDGWGGIGFETCAALVGPEFERVFYKNELAVSTTIFSNYMIFGGTNWGGISHPGGYTSYDYGSAIAEDRTLREKAYELKLQTTFAQRTPALLTSRPQNAGAGSAGAFTGDAKLKTTYTLDVVGKAGTGFYTVRATNATSFDTLTYTLVVNSSAGALTIPTMGGKLSLPGHDSKIHVVDYVAGNTHLLYSTAEIATWVTVDKRDVIVVYGNAGEKHETAVSFSGKTAPKATVVDGSGKIATKTLNSTAIVLSFETTSQTVVAVGSSTLLYIVDRANAYEFWTLYPPGQGTFATYSTANPVLVKGGYLLRSAGTSGSALKLVGDLNATASFEIVAPKAVTKSVTFNGAALKTTTTKYGAVRAQREAKLPEVKIPELESLNWKSADSLPEIQTSYSDAAWVAANKTQTSNPIPHNSTDVLYASEYGFHTGNIVWRAHFTATGSETGFKATIWGGFAFGHSVWLGDKFIGSWEGDATHGSYEGTYTFPGGSVEKDKDYVLTILQDHMGLEEDWTVGTEDFKDPRGLTNYSFVGSPETKATWKLTGNLGGEDYVDHSRGPLNEGGLFAERQGWHLPGFDDSKWASGKPSAGIASAGVQFYRTAFDLSVPSGVDYPMALVVSNTTQTGSGSHFRAQFYVNGWQFGKYVNAIGPQKSFPVPEGVLNYHGTNTLAVSLWAHDSVGAKLSNLHMEVRAKVETNSIHVKNLDGSAWQERKGAY